MQINEQLKKRSKNRGFYLLRRQTLLVFYFLFLNYSYWLAEKKLKNKKIEKSFVGVGACQNTIGFQKDSQTNEMKRMIPLKNYFKHRKTRFKTFLL
jgi:hypothetical protein